MTMQSKFWGAKVATFFQLCKLLPRNYWQFQIKAVPLQLVMNDTYPIELDSRL